MQVLVLAVQNAVDYSDLGVATSGATLFRSIGGSLGTAVLGAIFANRLSSELQQRAAAGRRGRAPAQWREVNPKADRTPAAGAARRLPARVHELAEHRLPGRRRRSPLAAFAPSWFIRQLPLRETVATGDLADTYAAPRDTDSLAEVANMIGRLDRREGAREIIDAHGRARRRGPQPGRVLAARAPQRRRRRSSWRALARARADRSGDADRRAERSCSRVG